MTSPHAKQESSSSKMESLTPSTTMSGRPATRDDAIEEKRIIEEEITHYGGDAPDSVARGPPSFLTPKHNPNLVVFAKNDPEDPQNWSRTRRWVITSLAALLTLNITVASSITTMSIPTYVEKFGSSREVFTLVTTLFLDGYVIGPLIWAPLSEMIGRRKILLFSMTCYTLFQLAGALARNTATILACRLISGTFAASPLTNSGGIIADVWDPVTRGYAVSLFTIAVFLGPILGPIIGAHLIEGGPGWRWAYWILFIVGATSTSLCVFFVPETYAPIILLRRAKKLRKQDPEKNKNLYAELENNDFSFLQILGRTLIRPYKFLASEVILVLSTIYLALVYSILYSLFSVLPLIYEVTRGFDLRKTGYMFIPIGIGTSLGGIYSCWNFKKYNSLTVKWYGFPPPEERLTGAMVAGPILVLSALALGWTGHYASVPWYVPGIISIFTGFTFTLLFVSLLGYLVDTYLMYSASALAANTAIRSASASVFPLFVTQMYNRLGINWACTLIAGISLLIAPAPFIFYKYGARIRSSSKYAPCIDLKLQKFFNEEEQRKSEV